MLTVRLLSVGETDSDVLMGVVVPSVPWLDVKIIKTKILVFLSGNTTLKPIFKHDNVIIQI